MKPIFDSDRPTSHIETRVQGPCEKSNSKYTTQANLLWFFTVNQSLDENFMAHGKNKYLNLGWENVWNHNCYIQNISLTIFDSLKFVFFMNMSNVSLHNENCITKIHMIFSLSVFDHFYTSMT